MREIKFRIFRPSGMDYNPDWEYIESVPLNKGFEYLTQSYGNNLMQYTGLKDKNGKEIYEGDIVIYDTDGGKKAKVIWKNGGFVFIYEDGIENITSESWYAPHDIPLTEIIGNIYENQELLSTQPSQE